MTLIRPDSDAVVFLFSQAVLSHDAGDARSRFVHEETGFFYFTAGLSGKSSWRPWGLGLFEFEPSLEFLLFGLGGVGLFEGEPLPFDIEAFSLEITSAQARDVNGEFA